MSDTGKEAELKRKKFNKILKNLREIEELVWELRELDTEIAEGDFDVTDYSEEQLECSWDILRIVWGLEGKEGAADIDKIVEEGAKLGYSKELVEREITRLAQEATIYESVRGSGKYQITQRDTWVEKGQRRHHKRE